MAPGDGPRLSRHHLRWLVGEVVRRVSGRSIGTYLRHEIAGPWRPTSTSASPRRRDPGWPAWCRCCPRDLRPPTEGTRGPEGEQSAGGAIDLVRLVELDRRISPPTPLLKALMAPGGALPIRSCGRAPGCTGRDSRATQCDARSLARLYGACVSDVRTGSGSAFRILTPEEVDRAVEPRRQDRTRCFWAWTSSGASDSTSTGASSLPPGSGPALLRAFRHGRIRRVADPDTQLAMAT